jgi:hypothetical protein
MTAASQCACHCDMKSLRAGLALKPTETVGAPVGSYGRRADELLAPFWFAARFIPLMI